MKLDKQQLEIIGRVRSILEYSKSTYYICLVIEQEIEIERETELRILRNRIMFWRRYSIHDKWVKMHLRLTGAICGALRGSPTVGGWFESATRHVNLNLGEMERHNNRLYKQIRLAWLDRILETGAIE